MSGPLRGLPFGACASLDAIGGSRRVKKNIFLRHIVTELAEGAQVVENPERSPVRGEHQLVVLDDQVVHRRGR